MFLLVALALVLSARAAWRRPAAVRGFTPPPESHRIADADLVD